MRPAQVRRLSRRSMLVLGAITCLSSCGEPAAPPDPVPVATKLAFAVQPATTAAGVVIAPSVTVTLQDASGNTVTAATNTVTLALGTNPASGTLSGTTAVAAVNGVATFSALTLDKVATGYTLAAAASGLTGATSSAFNVTPGVPSQLAFTVQPANMVAGTAVITSVTVQDAFGNTATSATPSITLTIANNPASGTLSGTKIVTALNGVASFSNMSIDKVGTGYTLSAAATNLTSATSGAFNVTPGVPQRVEFAVGPTNVSAGAAMTPAITVNVLDGNGNAVTTATTSVTIEILTNVGGGTLSGTTTVAAVNGVATFSNLSIDKPGVGYKLTAIAGNLSAATGSAFNVVIGAAAKLVFTTQPTNAATAAIGSVVVTVQDAVGNPVTTATNSITMAMGTNPTTATLSGTLTVAAVNGVATFSALNVDKPGTGYTLSASATGLSGTTSTAFNVAVGGPAKLAFTIQPTNTGAGVNISLVAVTVQDNAGNTVTSPGTVVTIQVGTNPSGGTLTGTVTVPAPTSGVVGFSDLKLDKLGTGYTLTASATGLVGATSSAFNVTVGPATKLAFTVQPSNIVSLQPISPAVVVTVQDAFGNTVTNRNTGIVLDLLLPASQGGAQLLGTSTVMAINGVATFSDLSTSLVGSGYRLRAHGDSLNVPVVTSAPFDVAAGPPQLLHFLVPPGTVSAGSPISPSVVVVILDLQGNVVTTATNSVTLALNVPIPSGGTLSGTLTVAPVNGLATFSNLILPMPSTGYTMIATAAGLASIGSDPFTVIVGPPAKLVISAPPANTASAIDPAVGVTVQDAAGNTVTTATNAITIAIANNPAGGTLTGTTTVAPVNGVASFTDLHINNLGQGYTLNVSTAGLPAITSTAFNVVAPFISVSATNGSHACGTITGGSAYCWGNNNVGQLGDASTTNKSMPVAVSAGFTFAALSTGSVHSCGLTAAGVAYCWGANSSGQIGDGIGTTTNQSQPYGVSGGLTFTSISSGGQHNCGLIAGGSVYCWGDSGFGRLGIDTTVTAVAAPRLAISGMTLQSVSAGTGAFSCGVTTGGAAYCWGRNESGQLGNGATNANSDPAVMNATPTLVSGGLTWAMVSAGARTACGVTTTGAAFCWGHPPIGDGVDNQVSVPTPVAPALSFSTVVTGGDLYSCGLTTTGIALCWGDNFHANLGNNTNSSFMSSSPVPVAGGHTFVALSGGAGGACGLTATGSIWCWGLPDSGELGNGTTTPTLVPVRVIR